MLAKNTSPTELAAMQATMQTTEQLGDHPVIRTLYDHSDEVTCLDFHPFQQVNMILKESLNFNSCIFTKI